MVVAWARWSREGLSVRSVIFIRTIFIRHHEGIFDFNRLIRLDYSIRLLDLLYLAFKSSLGEKSKFKIPYDMEGR